MSKYQAVYPITTMCHVLGVSTSGYYAWAGRQASKRAQADAALLEQIRKCHASSHGTYLSPADFERQHQTNRHADHPDTCNPAAVLGPVKVPPGSAGASGNVNLPADRDGPCARRHCNDVGRDGRMGSAETKQKNGGKREDKTTATGIP